MLSTLIEVRLTTGQPATLDAGVRACTISAWLRHDESLRVWRSVAGLDRELVFTRIDRPGACQAIQVLRPAWAI